METQTCIRRLYLLTYFALSSMVLSAQNKAASSENTSIRNTKTDKKYGNTTEVYKKEGANDKEILTEINQDYGLGDVVRITVAPPPPPPVDELTVANKPFEVKKDNINLPAFGLPTSNNNTSVTEKKDNSDKGVTPVMPASLSRPGAAVSIPDYPESRTSTYTNTDKDNIDNAPPSVSAKNPKATPTKKEDMPPIIENADMSNFKKESIKEKAEKNHKSTVSKGSATTTTSKNYRSGSNKSYNSKPYKKTSWLASLFSKKSKPTRRKGSNKESGCYRF